MRICPVLDLLDGVVVRGIAGQRAEYRPLRSQLTNSTHPLDVARALRSEFGFRELYVADLDGIQRQAPNTKLVQQLADDGFRVTLDAGSSSTTAVTAAFQAGATTVIFGLESLADPSTAAHLCEKHPPESLLFSLDLQNGTPRASPAWSDDPAAIVELVLSFGMTRILLLDLSDVGTATGGSTQSLAAQIRGDSRLKELWTGGGLRGPTDLDAWQRLGADVMLVASALHDRRLTRADIATIA